MLRLPHRINVKKLLPLLLFSLCVMLSGCFEVLEDLTVKADGSGTFIYTVNMSQSKAKLQSVMTLDSVDGYKIPKKEDIVKELEKGKKAVMAVQGVSNVSYKTDFDNFIITVKMDFNSISTLNLAMTTLAQTFSKEKKRIPESENNYALAGKVFERKSVYNAQKESAKLKDKDVDILNKATYTSVYHFENTVKSCSNPDAKLSPNKKNVMIRMNMLQLVKGEKKIANRIEFN